SIPHPQILFQALGGAQAHRALRAPPPDRVDQEDRAALPELRVDQPALLVHRVAADGVAD
ncbi:MAG TPA: hypothetical protein VKT49_00155, partial [Bryobacteraceae bacterium]|nr:hypothetical protein [Bryobacteraceae bacterium]